MSLEYSAIAWNRDKKLYDLILAFAVLSYLAVFIGTGALLFPAVTVETLVIRAFGTMAFLLLHVILAIGPLCRLRPAFLPLLYNRRHLGVTMFLFALAHGVFSLIQFHAGGDVNPLVSLLSSHTDWRRMGAFPFQPLGLMALLILFAMAATSHDFWLRTLTPRIWKSLHMLVYVAYAMTAAHVGFGALQSENSPVLLALFGLGMFSLTGLHLAAAAKEMRLDREASDDAAFVEVCRVSDIPEKRARIVKLCNERVAVFRYDGKVSAVSNVCEHQNGPLGEGKIVAGCITCPWHGYQYLPDSGASPPPFTEKIPTFQCRVANGKVYVHPAPHPAGTRLEPARIEEAER